MSEPILHMTEKKDSLDIMYEMDMKELLLHPAIVELLNLVYEGKYSVSSSSLNISPTSGLAGGASHWLHSKIHVV